MAELSDREPEDALTAVLSDLTVSARRSNLSRCAQLEEALAALAAGELTPAGRLQAAAVAHQVVGSAGTFGFPQVSALAGALERYLAADPTVPAQPGRGSVDEAPPAPDPDSSDPAASDAAASAAGALDRAALERAREQLARMVAALRVGPVDPHQVDG